MVDHEHPEIHDRIDRVASLLEKHVVDSESRHKELREHLVSHTDDEMKQVGEVKSEVSSVKGRLAQVDVVNKTILNMLTDQQGTLRNHDKRFHRGSETFSQVALDNQRLHTDNQKLHKSVKDLSTAVETNSRGITTLSEDTQEVKDSLKTIDENTAPLVQSLEEASAAFNFLKKIATFAKWMAWIGGGITAVWQGVKLFWEHAP